MSYIREKAKLLKAIREYFEKTGAIEVITDILRDYPNLDSNVYPLEVNYFDSSYNLKKGFLHTSPEYEMKKILSKEKKDIYQITKVFRNFEGSNKHKTEFLMLEWYRVGYNLNDLMEDTKNIFIETAIAIHKKTETFFKNKKYDLTHWEKITVEEAFYKYAGIYPDDYENMLKLIENKISTGISNIDYETAFFLIYSNLVEPNLGIEKPTFIYNYPPQFSALAKVVEGKGQRFEAYIGGLELVNGYYEENNPEVIKKRLVEDIKRKKQETGNEYPVDTGFIETLKHLPVCSGASLGVDRLFMVLLNKDNIKSI